MYICCEETKAIGPADPPCSVQSPMRWAWVRIFTGEPSGVQG